MFSERIKLFDLLLISRLQLCLQTKRLLLAHITGREYHQFALNNEVKFSSLLSFSPLHMLNISRDNNQVHITYVIVV